MTSKHTWSFAVAAVVAIAALRLYVASVVGLGDVEAYYWTWSQQLAPGYVDHGAAVALLIHLGTLLGGDETWAVRLPFIVVSAVTMLLVAWLAQRRSNHRFSNLWALGLLVAMPMFLVAGGAANPDVPFLLLVLLAWWALQTAADNDSWRWCALAGLFAGLSCNAKLFGPLLAVALFVVAWRLSRRWLALGASLLAMAVAAAPLLLWNATHGWASLRYHLVERHAAPVGFSFTNLGKLVGGQLGYVSPAVVVALVAALLLLWRRRGASWGISALAVALALILPAMLLILLVPGAEPHWPAAGYLPLVVVAGVALPDWLALRPKLARTFVAIGVVFSSAVAIVFHLHVLTDLGVSIMPASYEPRYDLTNELVGWPRVAERIAARLEQLPPKMAVAGCHYTTCSQLAFAAKGRFEVRCPSPRLDQFDLFADGDGSNSHGDLLYLRDQRFPFDASVLYRCRSVEQLETIKIHRAGRVVRNFELQLCRGFDGLKTHRWPPR